MSPVNPPLALQGNLFAGQQYPANPNPFLRCPLPPISVTPDSLRQFYQGGLVPQDRIMTPSTLTQFSGVSGGTTNIISSSTSVTNTTTTTVGTVVSASVTTPVLAVAQTYAMTIPTSTVFVPLTVTVSGAARVELYGTRAAQTGDLFRPNTTTPGPGTEQAILLDVTVDSSPFTWVVTPTLPASNSDTPRQPLSYISVTNIAGLTQAITVSVQYLVLKL
jgi:hypothetical protein